MTLRHLQLFAAVADLGTMSAAAKKLYISQPTISQSLQELESECAAKLFERYGKRLHLTHIGETVLQHAHQVLGAFDELERELHHGVKENIRIGATLTVGTCILSNILKDFKESTPHIETSAYVGNTEEIEDKLLKSTLDIAIIEGQVRSPYLISIPIIDDFLVLACAPDHPLAKKQKLPIRDLERQLFVMREKGSGTRELFERFLSYHNLTIRIAWEATCIETIRRAILDCGCMATVSVRLLENDIRNQTIHIIDNTSREWDRHFSFVFHRDKRLSPAMKQIQTIMTHYKRPTFLKHVKTARLQQ